MNAKVVIIGAAGRMGRTLVRCLPQVEGLALAGAIDHPDVKDMGEDSGLLAGVAANGITLGSKLSDVAAGADVFIDFSFHTAVTENAEMAAQQGTALVLGTTGLSSDEQAAVNHAAESTPVVQAPNMSLGINLLLALVQQAAESLKGRGYDIEIIERHHRRKKDAPSGTAIGLGEAAAKGYGWDLSSVARHGREGQVGERPEREIGFHAVRGGDFTGDHTVLFAADGESIALSHRASSRDTFALGALRAARWVVGREPGLYNMRDVLDL